MKLTYQSLVITIFSQLIKFGPLAAFKGQQVKCWDAGKRDRGVKFNELQTYSFNPTPLFANECTSTKTYNPLPPGDTAVSCQRCFSSLNGSQVFPLLPCSQYTGFEACRMQPSFLIPAWYCTDCFSACHLRSLNPKDCTLFCHSVGIKKRSAYSNCFNPDFEHE